MTPSSVESILAEVKRVRDMITDPTISWYNKRQSIIAALSSILAKAEGKK